uniref:Myomegalin n=1 Tax=Castor canadensis TaxID=51338 RepID=A0A8C0X9Q9_CASCN
MLQLKAGMHQPSGKKGPTDRAVSEQKTRPEEAGLSSVSCSGKYSLIQDQARELTCLRQKMKIGRVIASLLIQNVKNAVNTFEELLSNHNVDHSMEQHFREQLAKGSQLAERLASQFNTGDLFFSSVFVTLQCLTEMHKKQDGGPQPQPEVCCSSHAPSAGHGSPSNTAPPLDRQEAPPAGNAANVSSTTPGNSAASPSNHSGPKSAQPLNPQKGAPQLGKKPEPGHRGSSGQEEMRPQKMNASGDLCSSSSLCQPNSKSSGADLLEKNLIEIQNLRQRLQESVYINDCLKERLEHVLNNADQGKSTTQTVPEGSLTAPCSYT